MHWKHGRMAYLFFALALSVFVLSRSAVQTTSNIPMLTRLLALFGGNKPDSQASVTPGETFPWLKGTRIEATELTDFVLPGALIGSDEPIGSIIKASSDDIQIGFDEDPQTHEIVTIRIRLLAGQAITLDRSAQGILVASDTRPRLVKIRLPQ
jgi:hypothetical protein